MASVEQGPALILARMPDSKLPEQVESSPVAAGIDANSDTANATYTLGSIAPRSYHIAVSATGWGGRDTPPDRGAYTTLGYLQELNQSLSIVRSGAKAYYLMSGKGVSNTVHTWVVEDTPDTTGSLWSGGDTPLTGIHVSASWIVTG